VSGGAGKIPRPGDRAATTAGWTLWQSLTFRIGAIGTIIAAICCVTPILGIALTALGLSMLLPWQDAVLLPALGLFALLATIGALRARTKQ